MNTHSLLCYKKKKKEVEKKIGLQVLPHGTIDTVRLNLTIRHILDLQYPFNRIKQPMRPDIHPPVIFPNRVVHTRASRMAFTLERKTRVITCAPGAVTDPLKDWIGGVTDMEEREVVPVDCGGCGKVESLGGEAVAWGFESYSWDAEC